MQILNKHNSINNYKHIQTEILRKTSNNAI